MLEIRRVVLQSLTVGSGTKMASVLCRSDLMIVAMRLIVFTGSACIADMFGVICVMDSYAQ
jgi:hypothetical protein